ncbi:Ig-like domain-containing protein [Caldilinea sp.]|uniref:Ig-like domain-containing protein n=1 Tax=Caldilinea sp. TaxID=2293560 RepID=UPI0030DC40B5
MAVRKSLDGLSTERNRALRAIFTVNAQSRISAFDLTVFGVVSAILVTLGVVIWRGDQIGLQVVAVAPADDSAGVSTRSQIRIAFDQPLAQDAASAQLALDPPVETEVRVDGSQLIFTPKALQPDTLYTARLEAGVRSATGHALHTPYVWRFTTGRLQALFTRSVDGREQLFVAPVPVEAKDADAQPRQLTSSEGGVWDFAVSPVDARIAFSALTETGGSHLWLMAPGGQPTLLLDCGDDFCSSPSWSNDGELLLFARRSASDYAAAAVSPPRLSIMHVASGERAPVFRDSQKLGFEARWSSDNRWITYLSPDFIGIGVYNLESGEERFYPTQAGEAAPWQPGRMRFAMNQERMLGDRSAIHLFLVDPIADERINLSGEDAMVEDGAPAWSPDGEWLAFRRNITEGPNATLTKQLWLMRSDGSEARPLTMDPDIDHGPPTWSPDGRYLLFHKFPIKGPDIVISVWVMEVASGKQWQVVSPGQFPLWLP